MNNETPLSFDDPKCGQSVASNCLEDGTSLSKKEALLDKLDRLPLLLENAVIRATAEPAFAADIAALVSEGARGSRAKHVLAVEVAFNRLLLKKLQSIEALELNKYLDGKGAEARVRLLEHMVDRAFRRLISTLDLMNRLNTSAASIRFSAVEADVQLEVE